MTLTKTSLFTYAIRTHQFIHEIYIHFTINQSAPLNFGRFMFLHLKFATTAQCSVVLVLFDDLLCEFGLKKKCPSC